MVDTPDSLLARLTDRPDGAAADPEAWARLVELYTPLLFFWARRRGLAELEALDLVQDIFLDLYQQLPHFRCDRRRRFRQWLHSAFSRRWVSRRQTATVPAEPAAPRPALVAARGEDGARAEPENYLVPLALRLMQPDYPEATWQAFWEVAVRRRPAADVARELQLSVPAVFTAVARVRRRLNQELGGLGNANQS